MSLNGLKLSHFVAFFFFLLSQSSIALANEDGHPQVWVYSNLQPSIAQRVLGSFTKATGIHVQIGSAFTPDEVLTRLYVERINAHVDVWFGAPAELVELAKRRGFLQVYRSTAAVSVGEGLKDSDGYWTALYLDPIALRVDVSFRQRLGGPASLAWQDLVRPELKDRIKMPSPKSSPSGRLIVATIVKVMGEERAFQYLRQLDRNVGSYATGTPHWFPIAKHSKPIDIDVASSLLEKIENGSTIMFPTEGTGFDARAISIVRGARRLAAARKLVDWSLSVEGQNAFAKEAIPFLPALAARKHVGSLGFSQWPNLISATILRPEVQRSLVERWTREVELRR
jgi:iron(III) transport system substrate-binding protein